MLVARKSDKAGDLLQQQKEARSRYEAYHDYREPLGKVALQSLLAIRRGVKEGFLTSEIESDETGLLECLFARVIRDRSSVFAVQLEAAAREAWRRLVGPSLQNEIRATHQDRADQEALRAAEDNVRELLLAPPAGAIAVLGVDPGYKNGCQLAAVAPDGKLLESATVYPHEPKYDAAGARAAIKDLLVKHNIRAVAIGNGAASRETDHFIRALLRDEKLENVFSILVSEAGTVAYSTSRVAKEEYPELDPAVRSAVSIARRLQDPLAELVKIEPRALVGGQHDVDQDALAARLHAAVESCVNRVGVEVNTASAPLLRYVAGINERLVRRIVEHRQANGPFASREELRQVPGFVDRIFEQAAGFLRIRNSRHPLDATAIHPESYPLVEKMAASLGVAVADLAANPALVEQLKLEDFRTASVGLPTLQNIQAELRQPGRDPRDAFVVPKYRNDILIISDLKEGMEVEGVVSNITSFGAFVDVGVHQDGLVHVSELSGKFVKDPREAVKIGAVVKVRVLSADPVARRISLSMKPAPPPKVERPPRPAAAAPSREAAQKREAAPARDSAPSRDAVPSRDRKGADRPPDKKSVKPKPMTLEEKLAILSTKFRTRV
jgi:uncharacterized protein